MGSPFRGWIEPCRNGWERGHRLSECNTDIVDARRNREDVRVRVHVRVRVRDSAVVGRVQRVDAVRWQKEIRVY